MPSHTSTRWSPGQRSFQPDALKIDHRVVLWRRKSQTPVGRREPWSALMMRSSYYNCLERWWSWQMSENDLSRYDEAPVWKTRTSKNAASRLVQKPVARTSARASWEVVVDLAWKTSPSSGWSRGSISTSWHTSATTLPIKSLNSLWWIVGESTKRTRHGLVRRKIRATDTCGRYVLQLPIIPKGQRIPEILFLQPKSVFFEWQGGQPRWRSLFLPKCLKYLCWEYYLWNFWPASASQMYNEPANKNQYKSTGCLGIQTTCRFVSIMSTHCEHVQLRRTRRSKLDKFSIVRVQNKILLGKLYEFVAQPSFSLKLCW